MMKPQYFADDLDLVVTQAKKSAEISHSQREAIARRIDSQVREKASRLIQRKSHPSDRLVDLLIEKETIDVKLIPRLKYGGFRGHWALGIGH